jgi:signal transduction histidine kinase/PAS domain-containing protein/ActR/RegA family two-component response regulator
MNEKKSGKFGQWQQKFFRTNVLADCKEQVAKENAAMLGLFNFCALLAAILVEIYVVVALEHAVFLTGVYLVYMIVFLVLLLASRYAGSERPKLLFGLIVAEYVAIGSCYVLSCVVNVWETDMFSFYLIMILSFCFIVKPRQLVYLQLGISVGVTWSVYLFKPAETFAQDVVSILFVTMIGIALGFVILHFRMEAIHTIDEKSQALRITELYQGILDETATAVNVRDMHTFEILYLNRKAREICGISAKEDLTTPCYQLLHGREHPCENCQIEAENNGPKGGKVEAVGERYYAVKGKVIEWSGREAYVRYLTDITDSWKIAEQMKGANAALRKKYQEELMYREQAVSEEICSTSRLNLTRGIVEEMRVGNEEGYEKSYRYAVDFADRIRSFTRNNWLTEEQKERLSKEGLLRQFADGVTSFSEEFEVEFLDGSHGGVCVEVNLLQSPETSEILAFIYNRDITREKRLQNILECIMKFGYDEIYTIDVANHKISAAVVGHFGLENQITDGKYEEEWSRLIERAPLEADKKILQESLSIEEMQRRLREEAMAMVEVSLVSKYGNVRRKQIRFMYLHKSMGIILLLVSDIEDLAIKERNKQEQLEEALLMAEEASKAKGQFLANMSHEIRTPMNAIIGLNSIIKDNIDNKAQVLDCTEKLDSASRYLLALLNDILDVSRIENGKMILLHQPFDTGKFWENVNLLASAQAIRAEVRYDFEKKTEMSPTYVGDSTRLQQILINLINNAIKFTPNSGSVKVTAQEKRIGEQKAELSVQVADTGIGISEEFLPHIFEVFAQQYADNTTKYQGSGLGLSIAKNLAKMMDGDIEVESTEGVGTVFTVTVRLDVDTHGTQEERKKEKALLDFTGKRVLLAEDHPLNTLVAEQLLKRRGFEVLHAENGAEAVQIFQDSEAGSIDVILMDIRMPILDGIEATKKIRGLAREDAAKVPIIAMTANAYAEDRENTKRAGMDAHLAKPIDPNQMFETIANLLS